MININTDFVTLLIAFITFVISVGGGFFIRYISQRIGLDKTKEYYEIAKKIVMAIEQLNPELLGAEKKDLALSKLISLTGNALTNEQADLLIESAVYEIKKLLNTHLE